MGYIVLASVCPYIKLGEVFVSQGIHIVMEDHLNDSTVYFHNYELVVLEWSVCLK